MQRIDTYTKKKPNIYIENTFTAVISRTYLF